MVVFGLALNNPSINTINANISNLSFTTKTLAYLNSLQSRELTIYPNPLMGKQFKISFKSAAINNLNLQLIELNSGRVVYTKSLLSQIGANSVTVNLADQPTKNVYIVHLEGVDIRYKAQKLLINK